jgi:signal peptidase II
LNRSLLRWAIVPVVALAIVLLDQWTKGLIEAKIPLWGGYAPFPALESFFHLVHYQNTGVAFGLFQGLGVIRIAVPLIVIIGILYFAVTLPDAGLALLMCLGLMLGGAIGNLIDRLQHAGSVTDFLLFSLPIGDRVYAWPAFNIADTCIVVGTILLGVLLLFLEGQKDESSAPAA